MTRASGAPIAVNGVDATTGDYLLPNVTGQDLAVAAQDAAMDGPLEAQLRARHRRATEPHYAPRHGIDVSDLGQTGWGVVFAADADPAVRAALSPLLDHRRAQAAASAEHRYREFAGADGYRPGESKHAFLHRQRSAPGPVDPDVVPYYLLLVGGPAEIPFRLQYQLGVQHAVGRLALGDCAAYRRYAESVVAAESTEAAARSPTASVFAPRHERDAATALSTDNLAGPLAAALEQEWDVTRAIGTTASRDHLSAQFTGPRRPELLLTASHGIGLPCGHASQRRLQGALLCSDWPGPGHGPVRPAHWFGADDLSELPGADLTGMIAMFFACFGAGTPRHDQYRRGGASPVALAPDPFVAALPRALLGRDGAAAAVVGQVDRMWSYSFCWPGTGSRTDTHRGTLARLRAGYPLGAALQHVVDRHAELASDLNVMLQDVRLGKRVDDDALAELWTACMDARSLVVLGDPAVRAVRTSTPPTRGPATTADRAVATVPPRPPAAPPGAPIEVATYLAEDPVALRYDSADRRIAGGRPCISSWVASDGTASHGVAEALTDETPQRRDALVEIHARLIEVSLAARRASEAQHGAQEGG